MRLRVCNDHAEFETALRVEPRDTFVVLITSKTRGAYSRLLPAIDSPVTSIDVDTVATREGLNNHEVISCSKGTTAALASRYARQTGRPVNGLQDSRVGGSCESVTLIAAANLTFRTYLEIRRKIRQEVGQSVDFGLLVAEDESALSLLLLKQIVVLSTKRRHAARVLVVDQVVKRVEPRPWQCLGRGASVEQFTSAMEAADIVVVHAHSQAHCGPLRIRGEVAVFCGSSTGGAEGLCYEGQACQFAGETRIPVAQLSPELLVYDGCSSLTLPGDLGSLPLGYSLCQSAVRGNTLQTIGNVGNILASELDTDWCLALLSLGLGPARVVTLLEEGRLNEKRHFEGTIVFVGDASTPGWSCADVEQGTCVTSPDAAVISWTGAANLKLAQVKDAKWAALAGENRLEAVPLSKLSGQCDVRVVADLRRQNAIVLVRLAATGSIEKMAIALIEKHCDVTPHPRTSGYRTLLANLDFLSRLDHVGAIAGRVRREVVTEISAIERATHSRNLLASTYRKSAAKEAIRAALAGCDTALVSGIAEAMSMDRWHWSAAYEARVSKEVSDGQDLCGMCSGATYQVRCEDHVDEEMVRFQEVCVTCGLISDRPQGHIRVRIAGVAPIQSPDSIGEDVHFENLGASTRGVAAQICVVGLRGIGPSAAPVQFDLPPMTGIKMRLTMTIGTPPLGVSWIRVIAASAGEVSIAGRGVALRIGTGADVNRMTQSHA